MRKIANPQRKSILKNHPPKSAFTVFIENTTTTKGQLLPLITIRLCNANRFQKICALLDTGSDTSYISRQILDKVSHKSSKHPVSFNVQTLNARKLLQTKQVEVKVARKNGTHKRMQFFVQNDPLKIEQAPHRDLQGNPQLTEAMRTHQTKIDAII